MRHTRKGPASILSAIAGLALVTAGLTPAVAQPDNPEGGSFTQEADPSTPVATSDASDWEGVASDTGLWIVQLDQPAVSLMKESLAAEASAAVLADYAEQLVSDQDRTVQEIEDTLGRQVEAPYAYQQVLNGVAVEVSPEEAAELRELPGVAGVYPDVERELETDVSHEVIQSPSVWGGDTSDGTATRGEGVVVGVIDSGINPGHPSFAETDADGYTHQNPLGEYKGVCADGAPGYLDICNDKLIGAYNFHPTGVNPVDTDSHGSHVASTIAGSKHEASPEIGGTTHEVVLQGVAPRANVISYKVCSPTCPGTATISAIDQAVTDGVDVLNYSISGSDLPWNDPVDIAFRDAAAAGVSVVASGGNDGPGARTVAKTGPWMSSTAATTHSRVFGHNVSVTGPAPVPEAATDIPGFPGDGPQVTEDITAEVRSAGEVSPGNLAACSALPAGSMAGAIALVERGGCTFLVKVSNAQAAGAVAVVIGNNVAGPPSAPGELGTTTVPTVMITQAGSHAIQEFLADTAEAVTMTIESGTQKYLNPEWVDIVGGFSSRGPSQYDMLAPTFAAPGVNILAAAAAQGEDAEQYAVLQGTSMASPHAAGATALMRALHPEWTPTQVRSALASTADAEGLRKEDGVTPAGPFDIGSGRINLDEAGRAGLVLDESIADMIAANPAVGGEPSTLNLPAMVEHDCAGTCTWDRTVTNVADVSATYTATVENPDGGTLTVSPAQFTLAPGASQDLEITLAGSGDSGSWTFGRVTLATDATFAGGAAIADAELPVAAITTAATPDITVDPDEVSSTQAPDVVTTHELTIGNAGAATLTWEFVDSATGVVSEQQLGGTSGIVSDYGVGAQTGVYSAEDFTLAQGATLTEIFTPGFWNSGSLTSASAIDWKIYADEDGSPSSHPQADGEPVWEHTSTPTGTGVDITDNNIGLDLQAATGSTLSLEPGTYWLTVYPSIPGSPTAASRWNWYQGTPDTGADAQLVDPSNLFGAGATDWTSLSGLVSWPEPALAYTLSGDVSCGADWVDVAPTSGSTAPSATTPVEVSLDSTGLAQGTYTAQLCLSSNDPDEELITVPVTMVVEAPELLPVIGVDPEEVSSTQVVDTTTEHSVTITNTGEAALDWSLTEAEAAPEGEATAVTLPQGGDRASAAPADGATAPQQVLPTASPLATPELVEGFEDITALPGQGWALVNNSEPVGATTWFQGNPEVLSAHQGAPDEYIGSNFNAAGATPGNISTWLLTPELDLADGATFSFWTRTSEGSQWADRLEVRMSTDGASTDVGTGYQGVGDFTTRLAVVNEDLDPSGYPQQWTEVSVTLEGLDAPTTGRLALRYFVPQGGPTGSNSNYIGVDTLSYSAPVEPHRCEVGTDIEWMSAAPTSGTTAPGASSEVTLTLDSTGLELGTHEAELCVASNDPVNPLITVPVTLTVVEDDADPLLVERWAGSNRYGTAVEISSHYAAGQDVVFVATGANYPDALSGSAVAGAWDAPVLLTRPGSLPSVTAAELARLAPEQVVVLGGEGAVNDTVLSQIAAVTGAEVERWAGHNRYTTAAAVSEAFESPERVFIATGENYADALAASARAGAVDSPVLLVRQGSIPGATRAALERLAPEQITVMGGDGAVDDSVVIALREYAATSRVSGFNRYATAVALTREYLSGETVYIASGMDWPDALTGAAKAGSDEAPMLLTRKGSVPSVVWTALERLDPDRIVILGGEVAVSEDVEEELQGLRERP